MKKAILISIIGLAALSAGFAQAALAYDPWWDTCAYYDCSTPENGNFNYNTNINENINDIYITTTGGGWYADDNGYDDFDPECDDNRDNDHDGDYDYPEDEGCRSYSDDSENSENDDDENDPECDDNRDNDRDGDYDYPEDEGCRSYSDDSEDSDNNDDDEPQCDDNRDNDNDGDEDYPEDEGCSSRNDDSENSDNNDNDDEPEVTTRSATNIGETSATLNGRVDGNGSNTRVWFEYSEDRDDIESDEETDEESVGSGSTSFDERITGLRRDTKYYFRAVAKNSDGEDRGTILSFTTDDDDSDNDDEPQCDDNRDNDRDGDEDYPEDEGCRSRSDDSENSENGDNDDEDDRNLPPFYTSAPATSVIAGQIYSYNADALSPNGRAIEYKLTTRPSGMTINAFTGQVLWATTAGLAGTSHPVRVVAEDSRGNTVTQTYSILVRAQSSNPPINPPVNPPSAQLRVSNVQIDEVGDDIVVTFTTNISARGSVRYGQASQAGIDTMSDFDYQFSQISENGQGTSHEVNLGPLTPGEAYFIRAFATAGSRSAFSTEFAFTRSASVIPSTAEVAGAISCEDGIDNDRDGVADAADPDCAVTTSDEDAVTFASTLESFGAFLISPWFLILVIIVLVVYIIVTRRVEEPIEVHGPIEIKS